MRSGAISKAKVWKLSCTLGGYPSASVAAAIGHRPNGRGTDTIARIKTQSVVCVEGVKELVEVMEVAEPQTTRKRAHDGRGVRQGGTRGRDTA